MALSSYSPPVLMARPASLPCPKCEGMLSRGLSANPLSCPCGQPLRVNETREDPEHPLEPAVWRLRSCSEGHQLATVMFRAPTEGPGSRWHECLDCGHVYSSLERPVSLEEATDRLAHLARERTMLARAGKRFSHPRGPLRLPAGRERRRPFSRPQAVRRAS